MELSLCQDIKTACKAGRVLSHHGGWTICHETSRRGYLPAQGLNMRRPLLAVCPAGMTGCLAAGRPRIGWWRGRGLACGGGS
jgi:hypothetical protein